MNVAIIPARGGSKRIPRKNIRDFCGKPIIAWSIEAARESGCFDRIVVSTDDAEIADVARAHGADVPFVRPAALSDDHAPTVPVIAHAVNELVASGVEIDAACCIYATAPFLRANDLGAALARLQAGGCDYVFSVTAFEAPIQRAFRIGSNGHVAMFQPNHLLSRSQDLEPAYHDAAQFYWGRRDAWLAQKPIFGPTSCAFVLPRERVQDIDTPEDWARAQVMIKILEGQDS
jgi:N-acylneuraminate cytidylyltransferase